MIIKFQNEIDSYDKLHLRKWSQTLDDTHCFIENFDDESEEPPSILILFQNDDNVYQTRKVLIKINIFLI